MAGPLLVCDLDGEESTLDEQLGLLSFTENSDAGDEKKACRVNDVDVDRQPSAEAEEAGVEVVRQSGP